MTATSARIGFVIEPYRRATAESPDVAARHGNLARESADPIETWFATLDDAQQRANERQALLSPDRRRFGISVSDVDLVLDLLDATSVPTVRFIDTERGIDQPMMVTEIVIDTEAQNAQIKVWG